MERICKHCEHFILSKSPLIRDEWGECIKPGVSVKRHNDRVEGDFTWADGTCEDFSPKKEKEPSY